jgi:hypothetical protein
MNAAGKMARESMRKALDRQTEGKEKVSDGQ